MRGSTGVTNEPRRETVGELKSGPQERKPHLFLVQFCNSSSRGWCSLASSKQSVGITKKKSTHGYKNRVKWHSRDRGNDVYISDFNMENKYKQGVL